MIKINASRWKPDRKLRCKPTTNRFAVSQVLRGGNKTFGDYFITYLHVAIFDKPMVVICLFISLFLYYKSYKIYKNLN